MKILCICEEANPCCLGGRETFERALGKMFDGKISFFSYPAPSKKYYEVKNLVEFDIKKNLFLKILRKIFTKKRILQYFLYKKMEKADIYILVSPKNLLYIEKIKSKKILVQHFNYEVYEEYNYSKKMLEKIRKDLDYFVFLSEYDKKRFIKEINFPKEKAIVIRHSCELELLKKRKEKNRNLIMICRLDNNHKRIDLAINAMKKLQDFNLNIYGDGKDREYLENIIQENNLKNVFLHGGTSQVQEKLDENGIFVMTSDHEGYGITNIEAMRRGLPIVLRNTFDSASDIVQDNGVLLEKEWGEDKFVEAVRKVYDNYEYYSENSLKMGKRHDFEVIKKEWDKLFESIN